MQGDRLPTAVDRADPGTDWPIARLHVGAHGELTATFYTPGLPEGSHDVSCLPVDAADELERLRQEVDQLRALRDQQWPWRPGGRTLMDVGADSRVVEVKHVAG
jgi:hypothetical protein